MTSEKNTFPLLWFLPVRTVSPPITHVSFLPKRKSISHPSTGPQLHSTDHHQTRLISDDRRSHTVVQKPGGIRKRGPKNPSTLFLIQPPDNTIHSTAGSGKMIVHYTLSVAEFSL
ncbi:hypothetical protein I3843_05G082500 [Carya illinoinensis]|nr:hypothetical protein I3843_05G082500 [Carya illinoinensis]